MVTYELANGALTLKVEGFDKVLALKSELRIPLEHVTSLALAGEVADTWWHGIKLPGSNIPGVVTAGTFYQHGKKIFWDVHHPAAAVIVSLEHESYDELVVEVADPQKFIADVRAVIPRR